MVSVAARVIRLGAVTVIVTLAPDASEPEDGETVSLPTAAEPTATVEPVTGPPTAVSVIVPVGFPLTTASTSRAGDTDRVPWATVGDGEADARAVGDEVGEAGREPG